jgi:SAM-dependent methyltransferase
MKKWLRGPQRGVGSILDSYVKVAPAARNAIDIFRGEWSSRLPASLGARGDGTSSLFDDERIRWFLGAVGGVEGRRVLELGPLEAGHTSMLERAGAAEVVAVEANTRAYLKCLVVKELLGLTRARFLCGDLIEYLRQEAGTFHVCVASGVLYHMRNPAELIALLARACAGPIFLWTHHYDPAVIEADPRLCRKFSGRTEVRHEDFSCVGWRQEYGGSLRSASFCGGSAAYSHWISRDDLYRCLEHFGFEVLQTGFDDPHHPNGPALALAARKT